MRFAQSDCGAYHSRMSAVTGAGRLARRPAAQIGGVILLLLAIKVFVGARTELDSVEAYHWLYAQHLALGYYDHPGMIGWMVWLSTAVFGDSPLGVRMVTFLSGALATGLVFLAGRRLYDERAGRLAALLFAVAFGTLKFGSMATPDAPLLLFWMATLWALAHALSNDSGAWWAAAGAFLGLAMLSKYHAVFLPAGVLLFLVLSPDHRSWLRRKEPYLAALIALVVFSPAIVWNAQNGWQSIAYQSGGRLSDLRGFVPRHVRDFVVSQLLLLTPLAAIWGWTAGMAALIGPKPWADRFLACVAMPILLFFLAVACVRSIRGHWMLAGGATLFLLVGAVVIRGRAVWRWLHYGAAGAVFCATVVGLTGFVFYDPAGLKGWRRLGSEASARRPDFIVAQDYHVAAQLAYNARPIPAVDFTAIGEGGKSFPTWWKGADFVGRDAIVVWKEKAYPAGLERARSCFAEIGEPVKVSVRRFGLEDEYFIFVRALSYRPPK
jgi:Dolichyl-phosphate-mannose-protein mannosyltransferase